MGLRHAEISFEELVRVEAKKSNSVARRDARQLQSGSQSFATAAESRVGEPLRAAHDTFFGTIKIDSAMEASQRRQRNFHEGSRLPEQSILSRILV